MVLQRPKVQLVSTSVAILDAGPNRSAGDLIENE